MKIKRKPVETVRIRKDRAENLKAKALELTIESGTVISESDLINFLIDKDLEKIKIKDDVLVL